MKYPYIVFCSLVILVSACSTKRKLESGAVPNRSKAEVYQALVDRNIDFEWFSAKAKTQLETPDESVSGTMNLRVKRDSAALVAVSKFGIEAARVFMDKKEYTVLYRLEGAYEINPIDKLSDIFSVAASFEDIQQLMFGNVILADSSQMVMRKDSIYYVVDANVDDLRLSYFVNGYTLALDKMMVKDKQNRVATTVYSDYRSVGDYGKVAYERNLTFPVSKSENGSINISFSEFDINVPKEFKFSIPSRYERIN